METIRRILADLPGLDAPDDLSKGRALLRPLLERIDRSTHQDERIPVDPALCPNCDAPVASERSPYCSVSCRQVSGYVRRFRSSLASGAISDAEHQSVLGGFLWGLHGGFPLRQRMVPPKVRAKIIERDGGRCTVCGAPATEVDHALRADGGSG